MHGNINSFLFHHAGFYGTDCARPRQGQGWSPGLHLPGHPAHRPWLLRTALPAPGALLGDGSEAGPLAPTPGQVRPG
jgi:hypothetical protein